MGAKGIASDKTEYGPTWADVYQVWAALEKRFAGGLAIELRVTRSVDGKLGLRGVLYRAVDRVVLAAVSFGPAYANSAKTFPSALYLALLKAEEEWIALEVLDDASLQLSVDKFFASGK